ncbi:MAG: 30S ribosomal protein S18 [Candidatus Peregrinibacteria bacterium]|nr:30S ribosomal protein S18 [Candidatus Peregrinibacteria bacterium]
MLPPRTQTAQQSRRPDPRTKKCAFCAHKTKYIDYKDYPTLKPFTDYFGNIRKRYYSGVCLKHQKMLRLAMERARFLGMVAYRK